MADIWWQRQDYEPPWLRMNRRERRGWISLEIDDERESTLITGDIYAAKCYLSVINNISREISVTLEKKWQDNSTEDVD